jgi:hypothetical protein
MQVKRVLLPGFQSVISRKTWTGLLNNFEQLDYTIKVVPEKSFNFPDFTDSNYQRHHIISANQRFRQ